MLYFTPKAPLSGGQGGGVWNGKKNTQGVGLYLLIYSFIYGVFGSSLTFPLSRYHERIPDIA